MKHISQRILIFLAFGLVLLALTACQAAAPTPTAAPTGVPTLEPAAVLPQPEPTAAPVEESAVEIRLPVPVGEPVVEPCLACHIDKQRLIDTAKPVVVVESESSGEG